MERTNKQTTNKKSSFVFVCSPSTPEHGVGVPLNVPYISSETPLKKMNCCRSLLG
ncbi:mCG148205 [Mus musculus]|nr:mCG148205 [Mus musculus]